MDDLQLKLVIEAKNKLTSVLNSAIKKADKNLSSFSSRLTSVSKKMDEFGNKCSLVGAGITATGYGMARAFKIDDTVNKIIDFEHELRALGNTGGLSDSQLDKLGKKIRQVGAETNNYNKDVLEGMNTLVAAGMNPEKAINYMTTIGKTATSQQANINDIAKTTFSLADNMNVPLNEINYALNVLTGAGKEGRFELKAMAQTFPELTASASMLGMKGVKSVASLGAALQIAMKGAGTEGEAATNFSRFLGGLTSPLVVKNFSEKFGVSMEQILKNAAEKGADPIVEVLEVVRKKTDGNMFKVSEVFHDKTMLDFIKPMLQNMDEYSRIKYTILKSNNVIEEDYEKMMSTTAEQWKKFTISLQKVSFERLEKPLKAVNSVLTTINNHPILQKGLFNAIFGTLALGTMTTGIGLLTKLGGSVISANSYLMQIPATIKTIFDKSLPMIIKSFEIFGMRSTAHTAEFCKNIAKSGNKLGLNLKEQMLFALGADTRRFWGNIATGITSIPTSIKKSYFSILNFLKTLPKNAPVMFTNSLSCIKNGFLNIPNAAKKAGIALRMFSAGVMFNPVTLAITAIAIGAFAIYKYWKPLTAFFRGTLRGIKEGLEPLKPMFTAVGNAIKPAVNLIKKIFTPINTEGKKAENWGYKFGTGIAFAIKKVVSAVKWVKNLLTVGGRIGNRRTKIETEKLDGSHLNGLTRVPFDGYHAELHKNEAVLTEKEANVWRNGKNSNNSKITIAYNPVITIHGEFPKNELLSELQKHKNEIAKMIADVQNRKMRGAYA